MHEVTGDRVRRLITDGGKPVLIEILSTGNEFLVKALTGKLPAQKFIEHLLDEWFDPFRDTAQFYKLLKKDKDLHSLLRYTGFHMVGIPDLFEALCWSVIGQQISLAFAYQVKRRFVENFGNSLEFQKRKYYLFPQPAQVAMLHPDQLRSLKLTQRKAEYVIGIARLFSSGSLSKEKILKLGAEDLIREELLTIRGVGEWTANYTMMKALRAMDCVPFGDAGLNNALFRLKQIPKKENRTAVAIFFNNFPGWKTYLVYYLWMRLRDKNGDMDLNSPKP